MAMPADGPPRSVVSAATLPTPDTSLLDAARVYIELGWSVVPCCRLIQGDPPQCSAERAGYASHKGCPKPGKITTVTWKGRAETSVPEATKWWAYGERSHGPNMALLMGPGDLFTFDVDGPAGEAQLAKAEATLGPLPKTLENITGRPDGGRHLIFKKPAGATPEEVKRLTKSAAGLRIDGQALVIDESTPGFDLRAGDTNAGRSYIMVAPSVHPSGARYQWRGGPIAELPTAWWRALPRTSPAPRAIAPVIPLPSGQRSVDAESRRAARLRAALPGILREIRACVDTDDSPTNNTINARALRAFRLAIDSGADLDDLERQLVDTGCATGHPSSAVAATVRSAREAAHVQGPASLAERTPPTAQREQLAPQAPTQQEETAGQRGEVALGPKIAEVEDQVIAALAAHPSLYQRHPFGLCRVLEAPTNEGGTTRKTIDVAVSENVSAPLLRSWISQVTTLKDFDRRSKKWRVVAPTESLASGVLARKTYRGIRRLRGVIEAPMLRADGTVLAAPGYDAATGLLLLWQGAPIEVPEQPTQDDARAAFDTLANLFAEFTMQGDEAAGAVMRAACVAAILTPLARHAIDEGVPTFLWEADGPGAGKTLSATVCGAVVLGRAPAVRPYTADDDEMKKTLGAIALQAPPIALFDNIRDHIQGGALEQVITTPDSYAPRILGVSNAPELPWRTTLYLTANGVTLSGDLAQRAICIRLTRAPGSDDRVFDVPELLRTTLTRRPELLRAALTILRAHVVAGRPKAGRIHDRFPVWSRIISAAITWASGHDPSLARPHRDAVLDNNLGSVLIANWHAALQESSLTLSALRDRLAVADRARPGANGPTAVEALCELRSALADCMGTPDLTRVSNVALGRRLKSFLGKAYPVAGGGASVELHAHPNRDSTMEYRLRRLPAR